VLDGATAGRRASASRSTLSPRDDDGDPPAASARIAHAPQARASLTNGIIAKLGSAWVLPNGRLARPLRAQGALPLRSPPESAFHFAPPGLPSILDRRAATRRTPMIPQTHRRVVLARRPAGEPSEDDFRLEEVPVASPGPRELLIRVVYLSLDPYMRGRMREGPSYAAPAQIGEVMPGGTVGEVVVSNHPDYRVGDIVEDRLGWQEYAIAPGPALRKVDPSLAPISTANGVLGMPGMTAYFGLLHVAGPKPGETVVVSAASGAVGQVVGQIAKIGGCRAVGIAGGPQKCAFVKETLKFDACIDYKAEKDLTAAVKAACPAGVDVYFDNVGGAVSDAVLLNLNFWARVALCGSISQYNAASPQMGPRLLGLCVGRRINMRGFIVWDFHNQYASAMRQMGEWVRSGRIKYKEDIVEGISNAPRAFIGLLRGENFGKLQVRLGREPNPR
jgi:NADPH-dependent curcumin reductase CurA